MSSQRGNVSKRGQKHQNTHAFVHNKNSKKTEKILSSPNVGLCKPCTEKIEWRKKFRKYKPLTAPKKCAKCEQKKVKLAYHVLCEDCATAAGVCAKCLKSGSTKQYPTQEQEERAYLDAALDQMRERERRAFLRQVDRGDDLKDGNMESDDSGSESIPDSGSDVEEDELSKTLRAAARRARQLLRGEVAPTSPLHEKDVAEPGTSGASTQGDEDVSGDSSDDISESE